MPNLLPVQQHLVDLLAAGHTLVVRWDCGGDESWVTTEIDGHEVPADYGNDADFPYQLDRYLTELLELPDAGDFSMQGGGRIFQEGQEVVIEYQSEFTDGDEGDGQLTDEEWREMGLDPAEWRTETPTPADPAASPAAADTSQGVNAYFSGRRVLFILP